MSLLGNRWEVAAELRSRRLQRRRFVLGVGVGAIIAVSTQTGFGLLYDQAQWRPEWVLRDEYQRGQDAVHEHGYSEDDCEPLSALIFGRARDEVGTRQDQTAFIFGCFDGARGEEHDVLALFGRGD